MRNDDKEINDIKLHEDSEGENENDPNGEHEKNGIAEKHDDKDIGEQVSSSVKNEGDTKNIEEEEYEGKGFLYDTVFVDNIPSISNPNNEPSIAPLPVREDGNAFSIAPGEGHIPISRRTDNLNQLAFPGMFPYGECQLNINREVPLNEGRYMNSLIMRQNSRHHKPYFIFHAENQNEHRQLQSSINFQSKKGFGG